MTTICPYCKDSVTEGEAVLCPSCEAGHHMECWEENGGTCSVFGCESKSGEAALGCPWCDEVYIHRDVAACLQCGSPLMTAREFRQVLESTEWVALELDEGANPDLVCGYLRNNSVQARLERRPGVSMMLSRRPLLLVSRDDEAFALRLLREQAEQFIRCEGCGHILEHGEKCTYCIESGAEA